MQVSPNAVRSHTPEGQRLARSPAGAPGAAGGRPGSAGTVTAGPPAHAATRAGAGTASASTRCRAKAKSQAYASIASAYRITVANRNALAASASPELTGITAHSPFGWAP